MDKISWFSSSCRYFRLSSQFDWQFAAFTRKTCDHREISFFSPFCGSESKRLESNDEGDWSGRKLSITTIRRSVGWSPHILVSSYLRYCLCTYVSSCFSFKISEREDLRRKIQTYLYFPCMLNVVYPDMGKLAWPKMQLARWNEAVARTTPMGINKVINPPCIFWLREIVEFIIWHMDCMLACCTHLDKNFIHFPR